MSQSYHEQFRVNQRHKNSNGLFSPSPEPAAKKSSLPQRPTAAGKQPARSDTFTLPKKPTETNSKIPYIVNPPSPPQNSSPRRAVKEPAVISSSPRNEQNRIDLRRKNAGIRPVLKQPNLVVHHHQSPPRLVNQYNNTHHSSAPAVNSKPTLVANSWHQDDLDRSRRLRIGNDEYVLHREKNSPTYSYNDYHTENPTNKPRLQRVVRIVRDPPSRESDDLYYTKSEPKRIIYQKPRYRKKSPSTEYIYVDEIPSTTTSDHRLRYPQRSKVAYTPPNDRPLTYEEETIYVDDNGNEIEYIHDAEPIYRRRHRKEIRQPLSTNVVYE